MRFIVRTRKQQVRMDKVLDPLTRLNNLILFYNMVAKNPSIDERPLLRAIAGILDINPDHLIRPEPVVTITGTK